MMRKITRESVFAAVAFFVLFAFVVIAAAVAASQSSATQPHGTSNMRLRGEAKVADRLVKSADPTRQRSQVDGGRAIPLGTGVPLFLAPVSYASGGNSATSVAVADMNADGKPDILVSDWSGAVGVLLGNGDGSFQPVVSYNSNGGESTSLVVADVNRDGRPDIIVSESWDWLVSVLLGNGDGTFQSGATYYANGGSFVTAADVNDDGTPDLLVSNWCSHGYDCPDANGAVSVLIGNGNGGFWLNDTYDSGGQQAGQIAAGDLNGDGYTDMVVTNACTSKGCRHEYHGWVSVFMGNGDGSFQKAVNYGSGNHTRAVAIADVNGDAKPDIIEADTGDGLGVLLGNGNGTFQPRIGYDTGGYTSGDVAVADVNRDGKLDLLVGNSDGTVGVLLGNGDGSFQPAITHDAGGGASIAIADLNGDRSPDMVVVNGGVGVMLHVGTTPTTTSVASSLNPSVFTQAVTFSATVTSASGTPTGSVAFFDGSTALGTASLVSGSGSIAISTLEGGSHSVTAVYQGSPEFNSGVSPVLEQLVNPEASTTSLASSLNPALLNESVTYTASVAGQYGGAVTGTVVFQDGSSTIATVNLAGNQAVYTTSYRLPGAHTITAAYSGDPNNIGSASPPLLEQIIRGLSSKTVVSTSGSPSLLGQPVTFTATVTSLKGTIPDGELVTFYDRTAEMGSVPLSSGVAAYITSSLLAGKHTIKATYSGDLIFNASTGSVKQTVEKHTTTTTLTSSLNPSQFGQAVTFTAQVTSSGPTPTGKVKFLDGTLKMNLTKLSDGIATFTTSKLAAGRHPVTVQYLGDDFSDKSTSSVLSQVVQ